MIHLFLDANALLSTYGLTPKEVAELRKLPALMEAQELTLWLPEIVLDEYERNRPKVIAEALRAIRDARLSVTTPSLCEGLPERETLRAAVRQAQKAHSELLAVLEAQAENEDLPADEAIRLLAKVASRLPTESVLAAARERRDLRRPPGKGESLGDAISWEALLKDVPDEEDIHIVSSDPDFRSALHPARISEYLESEWAAAKSGQAILYADFGTFLSKHFAAIQVPSDIPKVRLIQRLATSGSFDGTHSLIGKLNHYDVFTPEQATLIAKNAVRNRQVRWIAGDPDVREFLTRVIDTHRSSIEPELVSVLERCMVGQEPRYSAVELDGETF
jgi:hypothetical protein